jgi:hypothetical protein
MICILIFAERSGFFGIKLMLQFTKRESWRTQLLLNAVGALGIGAAFAYMAPFQTRDSERLVATVLFWLTVMGLMWVQIAAPIILALQTRWGKRIHLAWLTCGVVLLASIPGALEVIWLRLVLLGYGDGGFSDFLQIWLDILVVSALVTPPAVYFLAPRLNKIVTPIPVPESAQPKTSSEIAFFRRLPPHLGRDIIALKMEDHYVRVYTAVGDGLIHCRFGDALYELKSFDGVQTHRSWYVARAHILEIKRSRSRTRLVLQSGLDVPVSRTFSRAVLEMIDRGAA